MATTKGIYVRVPGVSLEEATSFLGKHWGWMLTAGILYIVLGLVALSLPVASTFGLTIALGAMWTVYGVVHLLQAIKLRHEQGGLMRFMQSLLALAAGLVMVLSPGIGMLSISLILSFYFFMGAVMQWMLARSVAPGGARVWVYLSSLASLLLGLYILFTFPVSALWVPGTLLGIEFVFSGVSLSGFAVSVRRLHIEPKVSDKDKANRPPSFWQPSGQPT